MRVHQLRRPLNEDVLKAIQDDNMAAFINLASKEDSSVRLTTTSSAFVMLDDSTDAEMCEIRQTCRLLCC